MTPRAANVISPETCAVGIVAGDAHILAGITYRQLDHWARQGWVRPSLDSGEGRSGRRRYAPGDVVRLDLLRHLAESKVNTAMAGPVVAGFEVCDGDVRVLWGPVGSKKPNEPGLRAVTGPEALDRLEEGGAWVVYNPAAVRARIAHLAVQLPAGSALAVAANHQRRRSA